MGGEHLGEVGHGVEVPPVDEPSHDVLGGGGEQLLEGTQRAGGHGADHCGPVHGVLRRVVLQQQAAGAPAVGVLVEVHQPDPGRGGEPLVVAQDGVHVGVPADRPHVVLGEVHHGAGGPQRGQSWKRVDQEVVGVGIEIRAGR